jgi:hypothetical protein
MERIESRQAVSGLHWENTSSTLSMNVEERYAADLCTYSYRSSDLPMVFVRPGRLFHELDTGDTK